MATSTFLICGLLLQTGSLSVAGVYYEAPVWQHLHDETYNVPTRDGPKQFQVEPTVPYGAICSYQVHKHYLSFLIMQKAAVSDVLC